MREGEGERGRESEIEEERGRKREEKGGSVGVVERKRQTMKTDVIYNKMQKL